MRRRAERRLVGKHNKAASVIAAHDEGASTKPSQQPPAFPNYGGKIAFSAAFGTRSLQETLSSRTRPPQAKQDNLRIPTLALHKLSNARRKSPNQEEDEGHVNEDEPAIQSVALPMSQRRRPLTARELMTITPLQLNSGAEGNSGPQKVRVQSARSQSARSARILAGLRHAQEAGDAARMRQMTIAHRTKPIAWLRAEHESWDCADEDERYETAQNWDLQRDKQTRPSAYLYSAQHAARVRTCKSQLQRVEAYAQAVRTRLERNEQARLACKIAQRQAYNKSAQGSGKALLREKQKCK